jgi:tetratricopeptide (TPR) repeat protein
MALHLNPGCHPAWAWQGVVLYHLGLQGDARTSLTSALASNPNDPFALCFLGQTFFEERDYERASDFTERALAIDRAGLYANLLRPVIALYRDQHEEAQRCIREARSATGEDSMLLAYEAVIHAKEGRSARSQGALRKALAGDSLVHSHHTFHLAAVAYAVLGNPRRSVELLRKAATSGFPNYTGFRDDPHFRPLHRYAPFLKLMADLKRQVARHDRKFRAAGAERVA